MNQEIVPAHSVPAPRPPSRGLLVHLPIGFASVLHFAAYVLGAGASESSVAEKALRRAFGERR